MTPRVISPFRYMAPYKRIRKASLVLYGLSNTPSAEHEMWFAVLDRAMRDLIEKPSIRMSAIDFFQSVHFEIICEAISLEPKGVRAVLSAIGLSVEPMRKRPAANRARINTGGTSNHVRN